MIRMANLCIISSHCVNGVSEIHSNILKSYIFKDFYEMIPKKFVNKTNGVTPRRWIKCANPNLANIFDKYIKKNDIDWLSDLSRINELEEYCENEYF
jgi:starch phosphorylase